MDQYRFDPAAWQSPRPEQSDVYDTGYYLREAWRTLRGDGPLALARKSWDEVKRRRQPPFQPPPAGDDVRQSPSYQVMQAIITAANDVVGKYADMVEKRAYIQERRRRSDREIFETVRALSFGLLWDEPEYQQAHRQLIECFGLESLFGPVFDEIPFMLKEQ